MKLPDTVTALFSKDTREISSVGNHAYTQKYTNWVEKTYGNLLIMA